MGDHDSYSDLVADGGNPPRRRQRSGASPGPATGARSGCFEPLGAVERKVVLEILEDRYGLGTTIITQLDPDDWHPVIGDETVADAIFDRLLHGAHRIKLTGESLRKDKDLTNGTKPAK